MLTSATVSTRKRAPVMRSLMWNRRLGVGPVSLAALSDRPTECRKQECLHFLAAAPKRRWNKQGRVTGDAEVCNVVLVLYDLKSCRAE